VEGLPGIWVVKDKMHRRWKRKIDIYMGEDLQAAREWGRRKIKIRFPLPPEKP
jgi:3D (Asp-Asp-Asp) domain-containing protein